jgi:WD repeat and SOF domain-containing protein 1
MAVMDIGYSPTGKEFVTGSYDRTVRIWRIDAGKSREVYHTKRMQRVFTTRFTGDAKYVISGSDDMNVRIWKADASAPLGRQLPRERAQSDYLGALKKRFGHLPEIRRIAKCVQI